MFSVNVETEVARGISEEGVISAVTVAMGEKERIIFLKDSLASPPELWSCRIDGSRQHALTRFNNVEEKYGLKRPQEIWFKSVNDEQVHSWLLAPQNMADNESCSLVVMVLGDFLDHFEQFWNMYVFAAE